MILEKKSRENEQNKKKRNETANGISALRNARSFLVSFSIFFDFSLFFFDIFMIISNSRTRSPFETERLLVHMRI